MEIRMKRVADLRPYPGNPRDNDAAVPYLVKSIQEFGFRNPIVVDKDDVIVCGHTRWKAAQKLGMEEVPTVGVDDLTPEQVKAFRLADNKTAEMSGWNLPKLDLELLDLPMFDMSAFGTSEVENAILENDAEVFVLKSTVLPGTVDRLAAATGKTVIFSPEYYGGTQHCNNFEFAFTILGGDRAACLKVQQILQNVYDGRHTFRITSAKTAELVKYMENSFLATKVSFCTQFWSAAKQIGVDYEELRELFILDPRAGKSHTFVYDDHPFWQSHCLDKDVAAIAEHLDLPLLQDVIAFNEAMKKRFSE